MVKYTGRPGSTFTTSASEICVFTVTVSSCATLMMVGVVWLAFTVWPCCTTRATTMPSMGETILV